MDIRHRQRLPPRPACQNRPQPQRRAASPRLRAEASARHPLSRHRRLRARPGEVRAAHPGRRGDPEVTLKLRTPDLFVMASMRLRGRDDDADSKFEEDISPLEVAVPGSRALAVADPPSMRSRFSQSTSQATGRRLDRLGDAFALYPSLEANLAEAGAAFAASDRLLGGPEIVETVFDGPRVTLDEECRNRARPDLVGVCAGGAGRPGGGAVLQGRDQGRRALPRCRTAGVAAVRRPAGGPAARLHRPRPSEQDRPRPSRPLPARGLTGAGHVEIAIRWCRAAGCAAARRARRRRPRRDGARQSPRGRQRAAGRDLGAVRQRRALELGEAEEAPEEALQPLARSSARSYARLRRLGEVDRPEPGARGRARRARRGTRPSTAAGRSASMWWRKKSLSS